MNWKYHITAQDNGNGKIRVRQRGIGSWAYSETERKDMIYDAVGLAATWFNSAVIIIPKRLDNGKYSFEYNVINPITKESKLKRIVNGP